MTYTYTVSGPFRSHYKDIINDVHDKGLVVAPRGLPTHEIMGAVITIEPTAGGRFDTLATGINRELSTTVAAVEALQLIGGFCNPNAMVAASKQFANFMDGGSFWGGYGTRSRAQMPAVIRRLQRDPDTRQAQITFWDPAYDLTDGARDYPCTTAMRFFVRDNRLEAHVTMRSNDVFRGLPYDIFVFTQMQAAVASFLGLQVGEYQHHVSSLHLYESDFSAASRITRSERVDYDPVLFRRDSGSRNGWSWNNITMLIRDSLSLGISTDCAGWATRAGAEWYARHWAKLWAAES